MTASTAAAPKAAAAPPPPRPRKPVRPSRLLTGVLLVPITLWYVFLLIVPFAIVVIFSFGERARNGGYTPAFTLDNYARVIDKLAPVLTSLLMALGGTILALLIALPLAYFLATRVKRRKGLLILLLVIPFWTSFLIRTYAWLTILGPEAIGGTIGDFLGDPRFRILGTPGAVLLGIVYGYLPLMIFPLYVTLERMDRTLIEASKDLGAGRWATFRQVTLPIVLPGVVTGSILVFIPLMGEYVIPSLLGYGRVFLVGNVLVDAFVQSRDWPFGAAYAVLLIAIMLVTITAYVAFVNRGRQVREVSVL